MRLKVDSVRRFAALFIILAALDGCGPEDGGPARPWEFLDATDQIEVIQDPPGLFRAAVEGDLDNDGDLDVVVAQNRTSAGVVGEPYRGTVFMNEDGRFVDRTADYLPEYLKPEVRWWVTIHDFAGPNGTPDGWRDVFAPGGQGMPSRLFRNLGVDADGRFLGFVDESWRIESPLSKVTHSYHSHKADFDRDGVMDVLVYQFRPDLGFGQSRILMNRAGRLIDETDERLPAREEPSVFGHAEDLNGDGFNDISVCNLKNGLVPGVPPGVPTLRVLINDGTGHFPPALEQVMPERETPFGAGVYALEVIDANADGREDLYVINWGRGSNSFRDGIILNLGEGNRLFNTIVYPVLPDERVDNDGDHPIAKDFDGDGKIDLMVSQFASPPFMLRNESVGGQTILREWTPPDMRREPGFRAKAFDANGDGAPDVWFAARAGHRLMIGNVPEREPNDHWRDADPTTTFPALRTGRTSAPSDKDIFGLPRRARTEGATIILRPAPDTDLKLALLDAAGEVLDVSENPGNGVVETLEVPADSQAAFVRVKLQGAGGSGTYRLEFVATGGRGAPGDAGSEAPVTRFR